MSLHAVKILEINITNSSKKEILEEIQKRFLSPAPQTGKMTKNGAKLTTIVTPNPEQIVLAQNNARFRDILNHADVALPDGVGVVWASRFLSHFSSLNSHFSILQTIPGVEFMQDLVLLAAKRSIRVALIGGRSGVALKAFECLAKKYPGLRGIAKDAPDFRIAGNELQMTGENAYFEELAKQVLREKVQIIFVGLGAPKQEFFIERLCQEMSFRPTSRNPEKKTLIPGQARDDKGIIFMSVGGSFDVFAGKIRRAPVLVRSIGFEWLWRLILEPWRIKRQLALIKFIILVLRKRPQ